jgi:hypothetical protein
MRCLTQATVTIIITSLIGLIMIGCEEFLPSPQSKFRMRISQIPMFLYLIGPHLLLRFRRACQLWKLKVAGKHYYPLCLLFLSDEWLFLLGLLRLSM